MIRHFACIFLSLASALPAQVFQFPKDRIYVKEGYPRKISGPAYSEFYYAPLLADTAAQRVYYKKAQQVRLKWNKEPAKFNDCVLFNRDPTAYFDSAGHITLFGQARGMRSGYTEGVPSLRFAVDSSKCRIDSLFNVIYYADINFDKYIQPFYFRKFEVTNREYRQFVYYVRDSIARTLLAEKGYKDYILKELTDSSGSKRYLLNREKKIEWDSNNDPYMAVLNALGLTYGHYGPRGIDTRRLEYVYTEIVNGKRQERKLNILS